MKVDPTQVITLSEKNSRDVLKLIASSHESPMDINTVLPWRQGVDKGGLPKKPEQCWIFGTPYYEKLTDVQRHELLWEETARDVSMFIILEQTLPPLYLGYINQHRGKLSPEVYEYLMIFSKEEIVHTLAFQRYMRLAELRLFNPPDGLHELLVQQLPTMHPVAGVLCTLILEWVAESAAMYGTQSDEIEPLTREMFYQHHIDEARHIAFGRWVGEAYFDVAAEPQAQEMRKLLLSLFNRLIAQFTYNPEIAEHTSFPFPIQRADQAAIDIVRTSQSNVALNQKRFAPLYSWLRKIQVI